MVRGMTWEVERAVREPPLRGASARGRTGWQRDSSAPLRCVQNDMWEGREGDRYGSPCGCWLMTSGGEDGSPHSRGQRVGEGVMATRFLGSASLRSE